MPIALAACSYPVLWTLSLRQNSLVLLVFWAVLLVSPHRDVAYA